MVYEYKEEPSNVIQNIVNHSITINKTKKVNTYIFCNNMIFCKDINYIYNIGVALRDSDKSEEDNLKLLRSEIENVFGTDIYDINGIFQKITLGTHGYNLFKEYKAKYVSYISPIVYNMHNFIVVAALDGIITEYITLVCRDKYEKYMLDDMLVNTMRSDCRSKIKIIMYDEFKGHIKNIKSSSDIYEIFVDDFDILEEFCKCKNVELHIPSKFTSKEFESKLKPYIESKCIKSVVGLI